MILSIFMCLLLVLYLTQGATLHDLSRDPFEAEEALIAVTTSSQTFRSLFQGRITLMNFNHEENDYLTVEECYFFEDVFQQVFNDKYNNGPKNDSNLQLKSIIIHGQKSDIPRQEPNTLSFVDYYDKQEPAWGVTSAASSSSSPSSSPSSSIPLLGQRQLKEHDVSHTTLLINKPSLDLMVILEVISDNENLLTVRNARSLARDLNIDLCERLWNGPYKIFETIEDCWILVLHNGPPKHYQQPQNNDQSAVTPRAEMTWVVQG